MSRKDLIEKLKELNGELRHLVLLPEPLSKIDLTRIREIHLEAHLYRQRLARL